MLSISSVEAVFAFHIVPSCIQTAADVLRMYALLIDADADVLSLLMMMMMNWMQLMQTHVCRLTRQNYCLF